MKYTISNIDARITDYETKLQELKTAFLEGVAVHTNITVVRMTNVVGDIGTSNLLRLRPNVHGHGVQGKPSI